MVAQAGEDVDDATALRRRVEDAVRGEERQTLGARPVDEEGVPALLPGDPVALNLHVEAPRPEDPREPGTGLGRGRRPALEPCPPHRALLVPGESDEPLALRGELGPRNAPLALLRPQVGLGQEPALPLVACAGGDEDGHDRAVLHGELRADHGAHAGLLA